MTRETQSAFRLVDLSHVVAAGMVTLPGLPGAVDVQSLTPYDVRDRAVLVETGDSDRFGTPGYVEDASFLSHEGAEWLAEHGARLVGIDAANVDDMSDGSRPAHTVLLGAGIPIVEHLTGLGAVPDTSARFFAVPPKVEAVGSFPVRAFAICPA